MAEDWRVTVDLQDDAHAGRLVQALREREVEEDARRRLGDRIAVSGNAGRVFLYADSDEAARAAREVTEDLLRAHGLHGELSLERWHHEEERWEDASVPLPSTRAEHEAEHERLEQEEAEESRASGVAEWELRIELASHHDARALAERLEQEGYRIVRRWTFLVVGAADEDDAKALAEQLRAELPPGGTIHVEPGSGVVWELMPRNPFAVFGGLAA